MREIKFRAWSPFKEMISDDVTIFANGWIMCVFKDGEECRYMGQDIIPIMQYTGLKDKNGKEIYEGDIVSTDLDRPFLIVEFRNGAFMYQCHDDGQDYYDHMESAFSDVIESTKYHEVIGNIYENPELLEG